MLETVQTALTGSDAYYWFVAGFGNVDRLRKSHLGPIDVPIINAIISLIVQGYFCYRIWVLNKRSPWICWIIAVVCIQISYILQAADVFLNAGCGDSISRSVVVECQSQSYATLPQIIFLTVHLANRGWEYWGCQVSNVRT